LCKQETHRKDLFRLYNFLIRANQCSAFNCESVHSLLNSSTTTLDYILPRTHSASGMGFNHSMLIWSTLRVGHRYVLTYVQLGIAYAYEMVLGTWYVEILHRRYNTVRWRQMPGLWLVGLGLELGVLLTLYYQVLHCTAPSVRHL